MGDIQAHVRLQAIATLAKVAEYKSATTDPFSSAFKNMPNDNPYSKNIPEKIFVALECLLEDSNDRVRCAAAISLYSLNRPCDEVSHCNCCVSCFFTICLHTPSRPLIR